MKKILLLALIIISATVSSQNIRKAKDITKLTKGCPRTNVFYYSIPKMTGYKEFEFVRLNDVNNEKLTSVEKELIDKYVDVCFAFYKSQIFNCYWVRDTKGNVGMIKFDGTVLVEPVMGNIVQGSRPSRVFVGECTFIPEKWTPRLAGYFYIHDGTGLGHFAGVVEDAFSDKIHVSIPVGKYDDMMLALKGSSTFYFVGNFENEESMLWGVIDNKGKEVLPVKFKGIYRKGGMRVLNGTKVGGSWVGSETFDMDAINYMVAKDAEHVQERRQKLVSALSQFATNMDNLANSISVESSPSNNNLNIESSTTKERSSKNEKYDMSEQNAYNNDKSTYSKYDSMLSSAFSGNRSATLSEIKDWQSKMKKLREKWESKGKSFPHSQNESKSYK